MRAIVQLQPGMESRTFSVQRGVRQGDPLSPVLFNLVMRSVLAEVDAIWQRRGYGSNVGQKLDGHRLTHVAFADDMTLVTRSWLSLKRMLAMLRGALSKRGLDLHPSKCKAQTNLTDWALRGEVPIVSGFSLHVLPEDAPLDVLGTVVALKETTQVEIDHRIATSWRKFWSLKRLLLNRSVSIKQRLRLFDSTVGCCMLWCCRSWTARVQEVNRINTAWHSMLRRICRHGRAPDESYIDWIRRSTAKARQLAEGAGIRNWCRSYAAYKWAWAGHVARRGANTWLWNVTSWRDSSWTTCSLAVGGERPLRPSRRRWMKWEHVVQTFSRQAGLGNWISSTLDREGWMASQQEFVTFMCKAP